MFDGLYRNLELKDDKCGCQDCLCRQIDISRREERVRARRHHDGVLALLVDRDVGSAGVRPRVTDYRSAVNPCRAEAFKEDITIRIGTESGDEDNVCAGSGGGYRLVGSLTTCNMA